MHITPQSDNFDPSQSPVLIVPTRNRPSSMASLLEYLARFYPGLRVIVADGSDDGASIADHEDIDQFRRHINIDHRRFSPSVGYFDRLNLVFADMPDEYFVVGADDDYPVCESLCEARRFLVENRSYSVCGGQNIFLTYMIDGSIRVEKSKYISVDHPYPQERCKIYTNGFFPTFYSVAKKRVHVERIEFSSKFLLPGFNDYMIGLLDMINGRFKALDHTLFYRTTNPKHSYVRVVDRTGFLQHADKVLQMIDILRDRMVQKANRLSVARAQTISIDLIMKRVHFLTRPREHMVEIGSHATEPSKNSNLSDPRMQFVMAMLGTVARSNDNMGENHFRADL